MKEITQSNLDKLSELIPEMNSIGENISEITQRPATIGHTGEYIASHVFDIEFEELANAKVIDGRFRSDNKAGKSVNVKWYSKLEYILDINPNALPDFFLVMTGPKASEPISKGGIRPWLIDYVFLFNAAELMIELKARGVKIGIATSVRKHEFQAAEIFPDKKNMPYRMTDDQMGKLLEFGSGLVGSWY